MPRRPNTKNIPSRLFEDSSTPTFIVNSKLTIEYANNALAALFEMDRDEFVGKSLEYVADCRAEKPDDLLNLLCPPPVFFQSPPTESHDSEKFCFGAILPNQKAFLIRCSNLSAHDNANDSLVCVMYPSTENESLLSTSSWIHQEIQRFRLSQSRRFHAIPFLGVSSSAKKCFAQARAYALLESSVLLVGHPQSQIVELAKTIHYSGFADEDEPNPLLPIDCQQIDASRLQEILIGHFQVVCGDSQSSKAYVLLMNVELLDDVAQKDLLAIHQLDEIQVRFISTASCPLKSIDGFDKELADRLSILELELPVLPSRIEDIPFLAQHILETNGFAEKTLTDELVRGLQSYPWKSDVNELETIILQACATGHSAELKLKDCSHDFKMALKALESPMPRIESVNLDELLSEIEVETIRRAIKASKGNKSNAARMLGITRARLHRKLGELQSNTDSPNEGETS